MEPKANVALQCCRSQPFFGEAALEEGNTGAEVGQAVHPTWDFLPTENLWNKKKKTMMVMEMTYEESYSPIKTFSLFPLLWGGKIQSVDIEAHRYPEHKEIFISL